MPPSALFIYLCASINGRCPSGVRLWSTLDFCRTVWELMSPKIKYRQGKCTVQAVGAFYIFRAFTAPQYGRWRHLLPLGADNRRVSAIGGHRRGTVHLVKYTNFEPQSGIWQIYAIRYEMLRKGHRRGRQLSGQAGSQPKIKSLYFLYNYPQFLCWQ